MKHSDQKVYCVIYKHNHGQDCIVYDSEEAAREQALGIIQEYRGDYNVDENISDKDALQDWFNLTDGREEIEICSSFVWS